MTRNKNIQDLLYFKATTNFANISVDLDYNCKKIDSKDILVVVSILN